MWREEVVHQVTTKRENQKFTARKFWKLCYALYLLSYSPVRKSG